jgi:hypothetical protein
MQKELLYTIFEPHASLVLKYFTFLFQKIPSTKVFKCHIETEDLKKVLIKQFPETNLNFIQNGRFEKNNPDFIGHHEHMQLLVVLKDGLILEHCLQTTTLYYDDRISESELLALRTAIHEAEIQNYDKGKFFMIKKSQFGGDFELAEFKIKDIEVKVSDYYNDDLVNINDRIVSFIDEPNSNGIVLFHGMPGAGKTSYIRHLIFTSKCRFIHIPNSLFSHFSDPEFIDFISSFEESAIILEDCEELLRSRMNQSSDNGIANLLNLGDGLLGDALKLKIICTFNCELSRIDEAMLRKGRLAYRYEFGPLCVEKSNRLLKSLGIEKKTSDPMTLAEIFNYEHDNQFENPNRQSIGF